MPTPEEIEEALRRAVDSSPQQDTLQSSTLETNLLIQQVTGALHSLQEANPAAEIPLGLAEPTLLAQQIERSIRDLPEAVALDSNFPVLGENGPPVMGQNYRHPPEGGAYPDLPDGQIYFQDLGQNTIVVIPEPIGPGGVPQLGPSTAPPMELIEEMLRNDLYGSPPTPIAPTKSELLALPEEEYRLLQATLHGIEEEKRDVREQGQPRPTVYDHLLEDE